MSGRTGRPSALGHIRPSEIAALTKRGLCDAEIAQRYGVKVNVVLTFRHRHGIGPKPNCPGLHRPEVRDIEATARAIRRLCTDRGREALLYGGKQTNAYAVGAVRR